MKKSGQLTIFVLIAIVLIVAIIIVVFVVNSSHSSSGDSEYWKSDAMRNKVDSLNYYFQDCIDSTTREALVLIAFQGGYYHPPMKRFDYSPVFFPYYYYEGQITFPKLSQIESELGDAVNDRVLVCLENAESDNVKIKYDDPKTTVKITDQNVYFEVDMPVTLESEGNKKTIELKESPLNINSSLYEIYEVAEYITNSHKEDPEFYCLSCVAEMAEERGLYVYLFPNILDQKITGIMIYENRTGLGDPYTYIFFNKYTGKEETPKLKV